MTLKQNVWGIFPILKKRSCTTLCYFRFNRMQVHIPEIRCTTVAGSRWIWVKMNVTSILRIFLVYFLGFDLIEGTIMCIHYQQKQPPEVFFKKSILKNFAKFTGNTCASVSFLIKFQVSICNFIKKETLAQVFSREFWWCF